MKGVARAEVTKFLTGPDGAKPSFYRMAELYFGPRCRCWRRSARPKGGRRSTTGPLRDGGVTILIGSVEE